MTAPGSCRAPGLLGELRDEDSGRPFDLAFLRLPQRDGRLVDVEVVRELLLAPAEPSAQAEDFGGREHVPTV